MMQLAHARTETQVAHLISKLCQLGTSSTCGPLFQYSKTFCNTEGRQPAFIELLRNLMAPVETLRLLTYVNHRYVCTAF